MRRCWSRSSRIRSSALTVTMLEPPDVAAVVDDGERAETQETPTCVTVKVWPPIVIVPVREVVPALAATL